MLAAQGDSGGGQERVGLDNNAAAAGALQARGYGIVIADAESFQLEQTFDVIVASDVLDLLQNLRGFIESSKRHLRPGGRLLISGKNPWYWRNTIKAGLRLWIALVS